MSPHEKILGLVALLVAAGFVLGRFTRWRVDVNRQKDAYDAGYSRGWDDRGADVLQADHGAAGDQRTQAFAVLPDEPAAARHTGNDGETASLGHTYAELAAIAGRDDAEETERILAGLAEAEAAVDPGWSAAAFAVRSDAWLAEQRANLGLVA